MNTAGRNTKDLAIAVFAILGVPSVVGAVGFLAARAHHYRPELADPCQHPHVAAPGVPCQPPLELYGYDGIAVCRCESEADTITPNEDWKLPDVL